VGYDYATDTFTDEEEDEAGVEQVDSPEASAAGDADTPEGRRALLEQMAQLGGDLGKLAAEALVALNEREAKAKAEAELLATVDIDIEPDFEDESVQEVLRLRQRQIEAALDARILADSERALREQGYAEDTVQERLARIRADQGAYAASSLADDPLERSQQWIDYQYRVWAVEGSKALANESRSWEEAVEEAQAGVEETLRQTREEL
jgi:hypothetical protein